MILGTLAYREPETLSELLEERGPERIVVASDYADGKVVTSGWTENRASACSSGQEVRGGGGRQPVGHGGREGRDRPADLETLRVICAFGKKLRSSRPGASEASTTSSR